MFSLATLLKLNWIGAKSKGSCYSKCKQSTVISAFLLAHLAISRLGFHQSEREFSICPGQLICMHKRELKTLTALPLLQPSVDAMIQWLPWQWIAACHASSSPALFVLEVLASIHQCVEIVSWEGLGIVDMVVVEPSSTWNCLYLNCDSKIPSSSNQLSYEGSSSTILHVFLGCSGGPSCWSTLSLLQEVRRPELRGSWRSFYTLAINLAWMEKINLHGISRPPWGRTME